MVVMVAAAAATAAVAAAVAVVALAAMAGQRVSDLQILIAIASDRISDCRRLLTDCKREEPGGDGRAPLLQPGGGAGTVLSGSDPVLERLSNPDDAGRGRQPRHLGSSVASSEQRRLVGRL